jgi:hypothetical protein
MGIPLSVLYPCSEEFASYTLQQQRPKSLGKLPVEILVVIAEFSLGDDCHGTLANLNIACKVVQAETASALYGSLVWKYSYFESVASETAKNFLCHLRAPPSAWRHIR